MSYRTRILQPEKFYTFHSYFKFRFAIADILQELGVQYRKTDLTLPQQQNLQHNLQELSNRLDRGRRRVMLTSERARREILISPILLEVADWTDSTLEIEYSIAVNQYLKGELDYYLKSKSQLLVVEAKQSDLTHGFVKLAAEMIALNQWSNISSNILYGAVTTGESWVFGAFDRSQKNITEDLKIYRIPEDLEQLIRILTGILQGA